LFATARETFDRLGLGSPADHVFAFRGTIAPFARMRLMPGFLLKKSPLLQEEDDVMTKRIGIGSDEQGTDTYHPEIYYSPFQKPSNSFQSLLCDLVKSHDLEQVYASTSDFIRPATDDRPFFYQRKRWSNPRLGLRSVLAADK